MGVALVSSERQKMTMCSDGLTKLMEECGELVQIAAKKQAYTHTDIHPDGKGSLKKRLEDEIADVSAACAFVIATFELDDNRINERASRKLALFLKWHTQQD